MPDTEWAGSSLEWGELPFKRKAVSVIACGLTFLVGFLGLLGIWAGIPRLYDWLLAGETMSLLTASALICLSTGLMLLLSRAFGRNGLARKIALLLFITVFLMALAQLLIYLTRNPAQPLEAFIVPESPILGALYIYSMVCITCASIAGILVAVPRLNKGQYLVVIQGLTILLINISAFGLVENWATGGAVRFFTSLPGSVGFWLFGVALFFLPFPNQLFLARPFYADLQTRVYTGLLCLLWAGIVVWQGLLNNFYRVESSLQFSQVPSLLVADELIETLLAISVLGGGLHILSSLNKNTRLARDLQASTRHLQEAFDSFALLAATLSHDLKAPIQTQISALEMIKSAYFGPVIEEEKNQRIMKTLIENNRYELDLVTNLVDMMRYEIHAEKFAPTRFEINSFLVEIENEMQPLTDYQQQHLRVNLLPENTLSLYADYMGMKRILHNLITNAIHHLPPGSHIEVSVTMQPEQAVFAVHDDGPGISEALLESLFEKFAQGPNNTQIMSSGLGLYISRQIVERHGGRIWAESSPENGTTFTFTIPTQRKAELPSSVA